MKAIKKILFAITLITLFACSSDDGETTPIAVENPFVRFSLKTNSNGTPYEAPDIADAGQLELTEYTHEKLTKLKIPVILSSETLTETVTVDFDYQSLTDSNVADYVQISPANKQLSFTGNQLSDTIYVSLNEPIMGDTESLKFTLTHVSDSNIHLGYDRTTDPLDEITIHFSEGEFTYEFDTTYEEITGEAGTTVDFKVLFPDGYIVSQIEGQQLFSQPDDFAYTLSQDVSQDDEVTYTFTLNENLSTETGHDLFFSLFELDGYTRQSPNIMQINIPADVDREGTPADSWFDLSQSYYRIYGERWRPDSSGECEWGSWFAFPTPVEVEVNSEFDANGDGYHDFKIGFISPNAPIGANIFDMKRIFDGENNSSPGLNLEQALEFFPENGNSSTQGTVKVVSQIVVLNAYPSGNSYNIPISGEGTYQLVDEDDNIYEIQMNITYDLTEINGTTQTETYYMYNNYSNYQEPDAIAASCNEAVSIE